MAIRDFFKKFFMLSWYFFLLIFSILVIIYLSNIFIKYGISYEHFIGILNIIIWPGIVLIAFLFFRKVFVYMFFSMEEFNFFGTRGRLKDITKVIEERVQERILQEKDQEKRDSEIKKFSSELEKTASKSEGAQKEANEYKKIAQDLFAKFKDLSEKNVIMLSELNEFRRQKEERENRIAMMRDRIRKKRNGENHEIEDIISDTPKANKPKV